MTLPVEMFYAMEFDMKPSVLAISTLVIIISAAMIRLIYRFTDIEGSGGGERLG
jgi:ABC-type spermidine/putrescine transport system permease subunit II